MNDAADSGASSTASNAIEEQLHILQEAAKGEWDEDTDNVLLQTLGMIQSRLLQRSAALTQKVNHLTERTEAVHTSLHISFNEIQLLSQQQFVQHRVATMDEGGRRSGHGERSGSSYVSHTAREADHSDSTSTGSSYAEEEEEDEDSLEDGELSTALRLQAKWMHLGASIVENSVIALDSDNSICPLRRRRDPYVSRGQFAFVGSAAFREDLYGGYFTRADGKTHFPRGSDSDDEAPNAVAPPSAYCIPRMNNPVAAPQQEPAKTTPWNVKAPPLNAVDQSPASAIGTQAPKPLAFTDCSDSMNEEQVPRTRAVARGSAMKNESTAPLARAAAAYRAKPSAKTSVAAAVARQKSLFSSSDSDDAWVPPPPARGKGPAPRPAQYSSSLTASSSTTSGDEEKKPQPAAAIPVDVPTTAAATPPHSSAVPEKPWDQPAAAALAPSLPAAASTATAASHTQPSVEAERVSHGAAAPSATLVPPQTVPAEGVTEIDERTTAAPPPPPPPPTAASKQGAVPPTMPCSPSLSSSSSDLPPPPNILLDTATPPLPTAVIALEPTATATSLGQPPVPSVSQRISPPPFATRETAVVLPKRGQKVLSTSSDDDSDVPLLFSS